MSLARREWRALGTTAVVASTDEAGIETLVAIAENELEAIDLACSRFRSDSELLSLPIDGSPRRISPTLARAIDVALRAARLTDGLVDPTVGRSLIALGYDADYDDIKQRNPAEPPRYVTASAWREVRLDRENHTVEVPEGRLLDLGATAKALAADVIAARALQSGIAGVLINLGGDIAIAGRPPDEGWTIAVGDDHRAIEGQLITLGGGGLATSSTAVRRWVRGTVECHHIVDPRTGVPAAGPWRTVSVVAASCVDANIASTAAIVMGETAAYWLEQRNLPSRLVNGFGRVVTQCGWPAQPAMAGGRR